MTTVLFACVQNAGRSQMAAAIFNALVNPARARAISAGTSPAQEVHPLVVVALREWNIELTGARPQQLTDDVAGAANVLITMGCGETCPVMPGVRRLDWQREDPKGLDLDGVRAGRDHIKALVEEMMDTDRFR